jgi:DNA-binding response OmpR family regulator
MRLLLAEDDAILADALSSNLRAAGFEVEVADNGAVAEYLLLKQPFDLGVIDLGLPLVDGLTVLKRVHAARPTLPLLILTALDSLDSRVAGLNAGADDYLTKPFDFPELEARIRALLRRARLSGAAEAHAGAAQWPPELRPRGPPGQRGRRGAGAVAARVAAAGRPADPEGPGGDQGADRPGLGG